MDQGIHVEPTPITSGEKIKVSYDGLLARSGAREVFVHTGFGLNNNWQDVRDIGMKREGNKWEAVIDINTDSRFNFCFHDNAFNWDNNSGHNWSFEVHGGDLH